MPPSKVSIAAVWLLGSRFGLDPQMAAALCVMFCAMPGIALYRINTAVSRGMTVMGHDILSRGLTETIGTTVAFLIAVWFGFKTFAPELAVIAGMAASGVVAFTFARSLFRSSPERTDLPTGGSAKYLIRGAISAYDRLTPYRSPDVVMPDVLSDVRPD